MVGNLLPDNAGGILVEFDYNNIIVVDPNKTIDANGNVQERLVDHENLVMFCNLEAEVLPRTKLAVGGSPQNAATTVSIAKINFLAPNEKDYFSTSYYDELTGLNTTGKSPRTGFNSTGVNQPTETIQGNPREKTASYKAGVVTNGVDGAADNGLLGITSISVRVGLSFIPSVTIELEDVQGRALFQLGDNSPYAAFFNLPYPPFYLTLKGYYGQAIRYQLNLEKFNARFNSFNGNYQVSLEFKGYKFNILNEILVGHLLATPHMYSKRYDLTLNSNPTVNQTKQSVANGNLPTNPTNNQQNLVTSVVSERGYEKISQVYSEYKAKGLIEPDFPEITFYQLIQKIDTFEKNIMSQYTQADVQPLTDCRSYKATLTKYYEKIYQSNDSWFNTYLNPNPIVLKNGNKRFTYKQGLSQQAKTDAISDLEKYIKEYNKALAENGTLGTVSSKSVITNKITKNIFTEPKLNREQINWLETLKERGTFFENENSKEFNDAKDLITSLFLPKLVKEENSEKTQILPDDTFNLQTFIDNIRTMESEANKKLTNYESEITATLAKKLEDDKIGLGFRPTVRNISAIIMASTEGFIRLMDEVHTKSWSLRNDPVRRSAILNNESAAVSPDSKQNVKGSSPNSTLNNSDIPIYPWPQFFVETNEDKKGKFQLKYLADPSVVDVTKGNRYDVWPEVEFVEEYLKGLTQKFESPIAPPPLENSSQTNLLNINSLEFPQNNIAYRNKDEIKFFYEIWERQYLTSFYTGLGRVQNQATNKLFELVSDYESKNIITSLGTSSPYLSYKLKNYQITAQNYQSTLYSFSNQGTGRLYQEYSRDFFVTPYINGYLRNSFEIRELNDLGPTLENNLAKYSVELENIIDTTPNVLSIIDTYPFTDDTWCTTNLIANNTNTFPKRYQTTESLRIYEPQNVISNFTDLENYNVNRPVTNFAFKKPQNPTSLIQNNFQLNNFYNLAIPSTLPMTVGKTFTDSPAVFYWGRGLPVVTTTSMLNTPFFVNSILQGVDNWRRGNKTPYKVAAYLFLNSLPLISLREKLKSVAKVENVDNVVISTNLGLDDMNYMFAVLKKFGAVHKLPYAWILKFGSIWHRYKTFKQTGVDIISEVWKDFDYVTAYDPITKNVGKKYIFTNTSGTEDKSQTIEIQLQSNNNTTYKIQPGFYPKVLNDFNVFYNGYDLFKDYTNEEIQSVVNRGLQITNLPGGNIENVGGVNDTTFNVYPWSVLLPANIEFSATTQECQPPLVGNIQRLYVVPSFGANINEANEALVTPEGIENGYTFVGNKAVFNGSARLFWSTSNFGYFDTSKIKQPKYDEYLNTYEPNAIDMVPFRFSELENYMKIDDVFGVFEKGILDRFEEEFLNFSKPISDITDTSVASYNNFASEANDVFRSFQLLFKNMMLVKPNTANLPEQKFFTNTIAEQFNVVNNQLTTFMEYDIVFKYGNPSEYNRRTFASFLSHNTTPQLVDPINFEPYVKGSLPTVGGTTLSLSRQQYPKEWLELELQVGFSTIENLRYKDQGSYITDFFIDNNIKFSVPNIQILAPIIKMYATQKLQSITPGGFRIRLQQYLDQCQSLQDLFINGVLTKVRQNLPNQSQIQETTKQSVVDGQQSKVTIYETFKALNDKWIAGGDYESKTIFEDILFLDRASRNIGDDLLIDVFRLRTMLSTSSTNEIMSVYTLLAGILIDNNFSIMNLPAYVNFYNVQDVDGISNRKPEGTLDFANNLWGTFLSVDYRNSGPKMVCFFTGKPSNYLELPDNNYYRFKTDAFDLRRASDNPLVENQQGKTDWGLSNRCVGFNVDIGVRNQNIFYSFQVGQDSGKATAEAVAQVYNMASNVSGLGNATQNVGLYNLYNQRSYPCTVVSLGNAMIQPTMYFNLRHVPMFNGPYMIQEVVHTITPGSFQTQFNGTRQAVFDYPQIDKYLQSINQNLLTKVEALIKNSSEKPSVPPTTDQGKADKKASDAKQTPSPENSCVNNVNLEYQNNQFVSTKFVKTSVSPEQMISSINDVLIKKNVTDMTMKAIIYSICYVTTYQENKFIGYGNNYSAAINLTINFSPTYKDYFEKTYMCVKNKTTDYPWAVFSSTDKFVEFLYERIRQRRNLIEKEGLWLFYNCYYPNSQSSISESSFYSGKTTNTTVKQIGEKLTAGLNSFNKLATNTTLGIQQIDAIKLLEGTVQTNNPKKQNNPTNNQNTSTSGQPKCLPPTIISFTPTGTTTSGTSPLITLSGTNFNGNTKVLLNGAPATIKSQTDTQIILIPTTKASSKIQVITSGGTIESTETFVFVDDSSAVTQQPPPPNTVDNDKQIIENAKKGGVDLIINYVKGTSKLEGGIIFYDGVLSKDYPATIFLVTSQGTETKIADFTIVRALPNKDRSGGNFVTTSGGWVDTLITASELNSGRNVYFDVYIPAFATRIAFARKVLPFDCPERGVVYGDPITFPSYERIMKNPCCVCYEFGTDGKEIIINGVTCNPTGEGC
jgi:hypothetical protein